MNTRSTVAICSLLSLMVCCLAVGYAAVADTLTVTGEVTVYPKQGIYIVGAEMVSSSNATASQLRYIEPTNLETTFRGSQNSSSVTYKITVFNNTQYEYCYSGYYCDSSLPYNGNQYLNMNWGGMTVTAKDNPTDTSATFNDKDAIVAGGTRIFYVTYTYGWRVPKNQDLSLLVNYQFGVNVDSVEGVAIDKTFEKFKSILNDTSEGGGYATLVDVIDNKYDYGGPSNQWQATYIGNVTGSHSEDSEAVNKLFGDKLTITIDDVETNVTVLIKREDVDGNVNTGDSYAIGSGSSYIHAEGCEMTLYLTTDKLDRSGSAEVYAAVFTCNVNDDGSYGNWYMLGDMFRGTAPVIGYEGQDSTGSFHTDTWKSTAATYQVTDTYSYSVASTDIRTVVQAVDQNAIKEMQSLLTEAYGIIRSGQYVGSAMNQLRSAFDAASHCYTITDNTVTVNSNTQRAQLVPLIKALDAALVAFN